MCQNHAVVERAAPRIPPPPTHIPPPRTSPPTHPSLHSTPLPSTPALNTTSTSPSRSHPRYNFVGIQASVPEEVVGAMTQPGAISQVRCMVVMLWFDAGNRV